MQTKKAKAGYLLVCREGGTLSVTNRVSAPDDTDLSIWEELPEAEAMELEREFNEKKNRTM